MHGIREEIPIALRTCVFVPDEFGGVEGMGYWLACRIKDGFALIRFDDGTAYWINSDFAHCDITQEMAAAKAEREERNRIKCPYCHEPLYPGERCDCLLGSDFIAPERTE